MSKVTIYLHGHLREKTGQSQITVEAGTAFEALKIVANRYKKELKAPLDVGRWKVKVKGYETKEAIYVPLFTDKLHVYPVFKTAKSQWVQIAIGATLMTVGAYIGGAYGVTSTGGTVSNGVAQAGATTGNWAVTTSAFMTNAGMAMIMSGVLGILFPTATNNTSGEASTNSKYLNGANSNTTAAGTRIPFGYGLFRIAGHYISYNVTSSILKTVEAE
jgi:predicted phage tail protein